MTKDIFRPKDKEYLRIEELAAEYSVKPIDIIHQGAQDKLPIYVLASDWLVDVFVWNNDKDDWEKASPKSSRISGPHRLSPSDLLGLEGNSSFRIAVVGNSRGCLEHEPDENVEYRLVGHGVSLSDCQLVIFPGDCYVPVVAEQSAEVEKPLITRERNNLLKIIAVLAYEAKYDLTHASKAAIALSESMQQMGVPLEPKALQGHLERALATGAAPPKKG